jgi:hypothetical protein
MIERIKSLFGASPVIVVFFESIITSMYLNSWQYSPAKQDQLAIRLPMLRLHEQSMIEKWEIEVIVG